MKYRFFIHIYITYKKNILIFSKSRIFKLEFFFLFKSDIEKIKNIFHSQSSLVYVMKISGFSYNCSVFGSFSRKAVSELLLYFTFVR